MRIGAMEEWLKELTFGQKSSYRDYVVIDTLPI